jgi:hypothetical protein
MDTYGWSPAAVTAGRISLGTITAATAWARVEAYQHYPSDVLAGIAIGHFFGAFVTDAFVGAERESGPGLAPPLPGHIADDSRTGEQQHQRRTEPQAPGRRPDRRQATRSRRSARSDSR